MSDSEGAVETTERVVSPYIASFKAWLEASWPLNAALDIAGYAEWLGSIPLRDCSLDHTSNAGWRAVSLQNVLKKAALWEKEPTWNGTIELFLAEPDGGDAPFRHSYITGHQRAIALHCMALHAWREDVKDGWVKDLISNITIVKREKMTCQLAAFRGLTTSLRIQKWSTPFSYLGLLELLISSTSSFARMSTMEFKAALLKEMPSVEEVIDINYLCGITGRIAPEALRVLIAHQEVFNDGKDLVPLTFWRKRSLLMLPSQKRRASGSEPVLTPESQRLLFERLCQEASKDAEKQWGSVPESRMLSWREASLRLAASMVNSNLEPDVKDAVLTAWPSGLLDADLAASNAPDRWSVVVKGRAKMAARLKQDNRDAQRAQAQAAAAEAEQKAALLKASASEQDHRSALWLTLEAKGALHWQEVVDATAKVLSESHEALQQGNERAETGIRSMQDAFRYQASLASLDVPQSWLPYLHGMESIVVADLSDLSESELPVHATGVAPIKASFNFLLAATDAVGILVLPSSPAVLPKLQAMLGQACLEKQTTWDFRFMVVPHNTSYMIIMLIVCGAGGVRDKVTSSSTWNGEIQKIPCARNAEFGWNNPTLNGGFWCALLDALHLRPLKAGSLIVEVNPSTSLIGSLYPEIASHNASGQESLGRILWLGAHCSPSPAKADRIARFLQEKAKLESSQERKRTLKAAGSLTDASLAELAMRLESLGHFPGTMIAPKRLEESLYQNLLPEAGKLQVVLPEVFEHRYQAPPADVDPQLSFGDERLPPLLRMARQCLQAKVAVLQSTRVASWGLFPAEKLKAGAIVTTLQFGRPRQSDLSDFSLELHLKVLKPDSSHVTHRLIHSGTCHSLSSYLHFVTDEVVGKSTGESMQRLVFLKPVFRVENGVVVADLQLPEDVDPFSKEFALRCEPFVPPRKPASKPKATSQQQDVPAIADLQKPPQDVPAIADLQKPPQELQVQSEDSAVMPVEDQEMIQDAVEDENEALAKLAECLERPKKRRAKAKTGPSAEGGEAEAARAASSAARAAPSTEDGSVRELAVASASDSLGDNHGRGDGAEDNPGRVAADAKVKKESSEAVPGSTIEYKHENGVWKISHPTWGLGFVNTRYMEDGAVVMGAGSVVHSVMNAAAHKECSAAECMEVAWQVKPSDWVLMGEKFGKASALFTVDSKLTGHTFSQKQNKRGGDLLAITVEKPVKKYKVGKFPGDRVELAQMGWPWINGAPGVPKRGFAWCWSLKNIEGTWVPDTFDLVVVKDMTLEAVEWFVQTKEDKPGRASKAARKQEEQTAETAADRTEGNGCKDLGGEDIE